MLSGAQMTLDRLEIGSACRVVGFTAAAGGPAAQRLASLGLLPGAQIQVVQVAPLGDPITIEFRPSGGRVSLRRAEAAHVNVETGGRP
jgi:Fe2+ transport system protein FeoA